MGPEQSERCKIRVRGLGLFSFTSRKIQNLTQNASKGQHLQTKHGPCRQLRVLWIYTSVGHDLERSLGCSGLKIIHPIPSALQKWRQKSMQSLPFLQSL